MEENLSAIVRLKPLVPSRTALWTKTNSSVVGSEVKEVFNLDKVFDDTCNNKTIFDESVLPLMDAVVQGYNVSVLGYGSSGSGKTHSLTGSSDGELGLVQEIFRNLMDRFKKDPKNKYRVHMSCLEIYCEKLRDLLLERSPDLQIMEKNGEPYIPGLTQKTISSLADFDDSLKIATDRREVGSTLLNNVSSRSHYIIRLVIESTSTESMSEVKSRSSIVHIVDLAGSENASVAQTTGVRNLEGGNINKSLLALTKCIGILSETDRKTVGGAHVPYRDSKLTRVLKPCLGGNSKTVVMCCISPDQLVESHSTLKFSRLVKNVKACPMQNEVSENGDLAIYLKEIEDLRNQLKESEKKRESDEKYKNKLAQLEEMKKSIIESDGNAPVMRKANRRHSWAPGALQNLKPRRSLSPLKKKGRLDFIDENELSDDECNLSDFGNDVTFGFTSQLPAYTSATPRASLKDDLPVRVSLSRPHSSLDVAPTLPTHNFSHRNSSPLSSHGEDSTTVLTQKTAFRIANERVDVLEESLLLSEQYAATDTMKMIISELEKQDELNELIRVKDAHLSKVLLDLETARVQYAADLAQTQHQVSVASQENSRLSDANNRLEVSLSKLTRGHAIEKSLSEERESSLARIIEGLQRENTHLKQNIEISLKSSDNMFTDQIEKFRNEAVVGQARIEELRSQMMGKNGDLDSLKSQIDKLHSKLVCSRNENERCSDEISRITAMVSSISEENAQLKKDKIDLQKQIDVMLYESATVMGESDKVIGTSIKDNNELEERQLRIARLESELQSQVGIAEDLRKQIVTRDENILSKSGHLAQMKAALADEKKKVARTQGSISLLETRNHQIQCEMRQLRETISNMDIEKRQISIVLEEEKKQLKHMEDNIMKVIRERNAANDLATQLGSVKEKCATTIESQKKTIMRLEVDLQMAKDDLKQAAASIGKQSHVDCEVKVNALNSELKLAISTTEQKEAELKGLQERFLCCEQHCSTLKEQHTTALADLSLQAAELQKAKTVIAEKVKNEEMGMSYIRLKKSELRDAKAENEELRKELIKLQQSSEKAEST